jgi:drug/metabolite transporter, DME family
VRTATKARLLIVLAALLFSTGGVAIKSCGLTSWQVAGLRSGIAALALLMFLPGARRMPSRGTLGVGLTYAGTLIAFVLANKLTTAANTIYLQSTAPLYILFLAPWLLHERVRRRDLLFAAGLAVGLGLFFVGTEPPRSTAPDPARGNGLAILSGVFWALTLVGLRWLGRGRDSRSNDSIGAVVAGNGIAFLVSLPWAFPFGPTRALDWMLITYLGVFQIGLAYASLTAAIGQVPAFEAALLLLVEPVFNPIWAWLIQGERPGTWALLGGAAILGATVLKSWADYRFGSASRAG